MLLENKRSFAPALPALEQEQVLHCFEAQARDVTSPRLRQRLSPSLRHLRVGTFDLNLTCELLARMPCSYPLQDQARYRVEVLSWDEGSSSLRGLPAEKKHVNGLDFFALAQPLDGRDEEDLRRSRRGFLGLWTAGLMLVANPKVLALQEGQGYCVRLRREVRWT